MKKIKYYLIKRSLVSFLTVTFRVVQLNLYINNIIKLIKNKNFVKPLHIKICLWFLISISIIAILYQFSWSGFGEDSNKSITIEDVINPKNGKIIKLKKQTEHLQQAKTLWDWLGLAGTIAVPMILFYLGNQLQKREKQIADANLRDEALQAYLDKISELLLSSEYRSQLRREEGSEDNPVQDVARVRTVTILRRLENDVERQRQVLDFLRDAKLFDFILKSINLDNINLNNAYLTRANLKDAKLNGARLENANLKNANLDGACFRDANLTRANLNNASLIRTELIRACLSSAYLSGANLTGAYLSGANLSNANLNRASLVDANLTDADFSGADLMDADLSNVTNLTPEKLKTAKNWDKAKYDPEFRSKWLRLQDENI